MGRGHGLRGVCEGSDRGVSRSPIGTSFAVFESRDAFEAVNPQINQILAAFGEFFSGPPSETLGDVLISVDGT